MDDSDGSIATETQSSTIEILQQKVDKLTQLLVKAKETIFHYKERIDVLEKENDEIQYRVKDLTSEVSRLSSLELPRSVKVERPLARVSIESEIYACVLHNSQIYWMKESSCVFKGPLPPVISESCSEESQSEKIALVTTQYEDRIRRLQETLDSNEQSMQALQDSLKNVKAEYEKASKDLKSRPTGEILRIVSESTDLFSQVMGLTMDSDLSKALTLQNEIMTFSKRPCEGEALRAREHLTALHSSLLDLCKRLIHSRQELNEQENEWKNTCSQLIKDSETSKAEAKRLKHESQKLKDEFNEKSFQIENLKDQEISDAKAVIATLNNEIKKQVNLPYLKNIIIQFISTSDPDIQERLINVISTILTFNAHELNIIKEARAPKGVISKFLGF